MRLIAHLGSSSLRPSTQVEQPQQQSSGQNPTGICPKHDPPHWHIERLLERGSTSYARNSCGAAFYWSKGHHSPPRDRAAFLLQRVLQLPLAQFLPAGMAPIRRVSSASCRRPIEIRGWGTSLWTLPKDRGTNTSTTSDKANGIFLRCCRMDLTFRLTLASCLPPRLRTAIRWMYSLSGMNPHFPAASFRHA